jgi:tRNA pseudouridine55 synthase
MTVQGIIAVDKPQGLTSFDVVREIRRTFSERKVGHAGTLDPQATGVLPVCIGSATKLVDYFHAQTKSYRCGMRFGQTSNTCDLEGEVNVSGDASSLDRTTLEHATQQFVGEIDQYPPMFSAVRHQGEHLYEIARRGEEVERQSRKVNIISIQVIDFEAGNPANATLEVECGKGAYMRVLAADLGAKLGCGGLLAWLQRTRYGAITLEDCVGLEVLKSHADPGQFIKPLEIAIQHLPRLDVGPPQVTLVRNGQSIFVKTTVAGEARLHDAFGTLIAIGDVRGGLFKPTKVVAHT